MAHSRKSGSWPCLLTLIICLFIADVCNRVRKNPDPRSIFFLGDFKTVEGTRRERERERERERQRQRERQTDRQTDTETETDRQTQKQGVWGVGRYRERRVWEEVNPYLLSGLH